MIKQVGRTAIAEFHKATCHCGAVEIELHLPDGIVDPGHCNCSICGIYTHHQRRSDPNVYGFNVGCLEGVNPFDLGPVRVGDGINHSCDRQPAG